MTAAAIKVNLQDKKQLDHIQKRRAASSWQEDAWEYYDLVGEIKYAFRLFANVLSRVRLYAAYVEDEDKAPVPLKDIDDDTIQEEARKVAQKAMNQPT